MHVLVLMSIILYINFEMPRFRNSRDMVGVPKFKMAHVTLTTLAMGVVCNPKANI